MVFPHASSLQAKPSEVFLMGLEDDFTTPSELDFWPVLTLPFLQSEARNPDYTSFMNKHHKKEGRCENNIGFTH